MGTERRWIPLWRVMIGAILALAPAFTGAQEMPENPMFDEHYTMLYYEELGPASAFYGEVLDLQRSYEDDWVHLYRATGTSYIGVVREGPGAFHSARTDNAVMVSLVTENVDAVHERVRGHAGIEIVSPLRNKESAPIRAFIVRDPGGYTVEVFQWLKRPE